MQTVACTPIPPFPSPVLPICSSLLSLRFLFLKHCGPPKMNAFKEIMANFPTDLLQYF